MLDKNDNEFNRAQTYEVGITIMAEDTEKQRLEIVDGQQRTITFMLLFRALFNELPESAIDKINIGKCLWRDDSKSMLDTSQQKVVNVMFMDDDKETFNAIIRTGVVPKGARDHYAKNFIFLRDKIRELATLRANALQVFAKRILENVNFVQHVLDGTLNAITYFENHNAKGVPLEYTALLKTAFCKLAQNTKGFDARNRVAKNWEDLEQRCNAIFKSGRGLKPLPYIFFLYTRKAAPLNKKISTKNYALFYHDKKAPHLKSLHTFGEIVALSVFLAELAGLKKSVIDERTLRNVFILKNINMSLFWEFLAHIFFKHRDAHNVVDNGILTPFLERFLAVNVGVIASGNPNRFANSKEIAKRVDFIFDGNIDHVEKFSASAIQDCLTHNTNPDGKDYSISKYLLYWLTFYDLQQPIPNKKLHIEHIFAKTLAGNRIWQITNTVNLLGNLALLEGNLNQKATNLDFANKAVLYKGKTQDKKLQPTFNRELIQLAETYRDFNEPEILSRNQKIIKTVLDYLDSFGLLIRDFVF